MNGSTAIKTPYPSYTMTQHFTMSSATIPEQHAITTYHSTIYEQTTRMHTSTDMTATTTSVPVMTTTENATIDEINQFYFYETEQFTVLWILFAVIVLGNSAVLVTLYLNKRKSRMNFFIKQLAFADLSVGLLNVLVDIVWRFTVSWEAGNLACKCIKFMQCLVTYASTYVLVALSIDRYDAIKNPMNFSNCWKRAKLLVFFAWTLSAIFSIPLLILYEETIIQGVTQCWIELGSPFQWQVYMSLVSLVLFFIPAIIITLCYTIIVKTIWDKGTYRVPKDKRNHNRNRTSGDDEDRGSRRASSRGIIPRAKVKTVKMTFVIVIVFIACWSPYIVFDLLQVYDKIPKTQNYVAVATFIQSLAPLNSAANPLIYCLFSAQVMRTLKRTALYRWIAKVFCCKILSADPSRTLRNQRTFTSSTVTTSLVSSSGRSTIHRPNKIVNFDNQNAIITETNGR